MSQGGDGAMSGADMFVEANNELLQRCCELLLSPQRRRTSKGSSNLYTEIIRHQDQRFFLKAVKPGNDRELKFYSALLSGAIKPEGDLYFVPTPLLVTQTSLATLYLFPFCKAKRIKSSAFADEKNWRLIRAVASFNAAHPRTADLQKLFEVDWFAPQINASALHAAYGDRPEVEVKALLLEIEKCFLAVGASLEACGLTPQSARAEERLSLAQNDFNRYNAGFFVANGLEKSILMDMGRAQIAPYGHDLRWIFHYACNHDFGLPVLRQIVEVYTDELTRNGISSKPREVFLVALAGFVGYRLCARGVLVESGRVKEKKWEIMTKRVAFTQQCLEWLRVGAMD
jgi:hypothetical protein